MSIALSFGNLIVLSEWATKGISAATTWRLLLCISSALMSQVYSTASSFQYCIRCLIPNYWFCFMPKCSSFWGLLLSSIVHHIQQAIDRCRPVLCLRLRCDACNCSMSLQMAIYLCLALLCWRGRIPSKSTLASMTLLERHLTGWQKRAYWFCFLSINDTTWLLLLGF
jgi:hypothetical protein